MRQLTLFIPGLFLTRNDLAAVDSPDLPALQRLLSRARHEKLRHFAFTDILSMLFNTDIPPGGDCPVAAITRLIDDDQATDGFWMRADPVHLIADQGRVLLVDESGFSLDQHDALVLAADIRDVFTEHGISLEAPAIHRWYLKLTRQPSLVTTPIHEVAGGDINRFMPVGEDSAFWIRLMNEVQMILHDSSINHKREAGYENSVNGVWFWGAGRLPEKTGCPWSRLYTDEVTSRGMAALANIQYEELPESADMIMNHAEDGEEVLVVMSFGMRHRQYHDIPGWQDFIAYLDQFWFTGMEKSIRSGAIKELRVLTENQQFVLDRKSFLKFWRSEKPVTAYAH